jgi:hypothetical protein
METVAILTRSARQTSTRELSMQLALVVSCLVFAVTGSAVARTPASIKTCLAKEGAVTRLNGPTEIDAWWHTTFVEIFAVKSHAFAEAIVEGGERLGKPPTSYVVHGSTVASFWKVPTKAVRTRVTVCI